MLVTAGKSGRALKRFTHPRLEFDFAEEGGDESCGSAHEWRADTLPDYAAPFHTTTWIIEQSPRP
jgi:hypothetical protein